MIGHVLVAGLLAESAVLGVFLERLAKPSHRQGVGLNVSEEWKPVYAVLSGLEYTVNLGTDFLSATLGFLRVLGSKTALDLAPPHRRTKFRRNNAPIVEHAGSLVFV